MHEGRIVFLLLMDAAVDLGHVLYQRAAHAGVDYLQAPADAQNRRIFRQKQLQQANFQFIPLGHVRTGLGPVRFAIADGVHIRTAGKDHAVQFLRQGGQLFQVKGHIIDDPHFAVDGLDALDITFRHIPFAGFALLIRRDADNRFFHLNVHLIVSFWVYRS